MSGFSGGLWSAEIGASSAGCPRNLGAALVELWKRQGVARKAAGSAWQDNDLVFASRVGTRLDAANVRREFRKVVTVFLLVGE